MARVPVPLTVPVEDLTGAEAWRRGGAQKLVENHSHNITLRWHSNKASSDITIPVFPYKNGSFNKTL